MNSTMPVSLKSIRPTHQKNSQPVSANSLNWFNKMVLAVGILLLSLVSLSSVAESDIYLVRHAEKQVDGSKDPHLTEQGKRRAELLVKQLVDKEITAIYSSDYQRTKQTAKPLAKRLGIEVSIYDPRKLQEFAERLKALKQNVLVVGHSNTTPALAYYLGGKAFGDIDESEYDRLYQIKISNGQVNTQLLRSQPVKQYAAFQPVNIDHSRFSAVKNTYQMSFRDKPVGKAIHFLKSTDNQYHLTDKTVIESFKIDADIELAINKQKLQPQSMKMSGSMGTPVDISLSWQANKVMGHSIQARAAYKPQGKIRVDQKFQPLTVERSSVLMLAHLFDLKPTQLNTFQWYNGYDNSLKAIEASYLGDKKITVPAGTFDTQMIQFLGGAPSQIFYVSKEAKPKVVQIDVIASPWQYQLLESTPL